MRLLNKQQAIEAVSGAPTLAPMTTNPFATPEWTLLFLQQIAEDDWDIYLPEPASNACAGPLYCTRKQPRRMSALANYYTSLFSPLTVAPGHDLAAAAGLWADQIVRHRPRLATVQIAPLDRDAPETGAIASALRSRGWHVREYFCFGNWYLRSAGLSYDDYLASRPSQLRNTIARKGKKFLAAGHRLEIVTSAPDMERAIAAFQRVYARSWKKPEPYPEFVPGWARVCAEQGWLRMGLAWVGDTPVAAQFWFTMHKRAYIFKLAYDEDHQSWSAGTLLTAELFRHSLDQDGVIEVDYLTGDDDYKRTWMNDRRERVGLLASNPCTIAGLLSITREFAAEQWRRVQRPAPGHTPAPKDATPESPASP